MTTMSDLSASLSHLSAEMTRSMEMLRQMNAILDRMNGVSSASSSSSTASATSAPTTTAATTPAAPPTPAASLPASTAAPPTSAASTTTSPKSFAPTAAMTPSPARANALGPTPYAPTTTSTPPTTAVAISFRLPAPPLLAAKKKITKTTRRGQRVRMAFFGAPCATREACTAAARRAGTRAHATQFTACRAGASVRRLRRSCHHGRLRPRRRGSGARPRLRIHGLLMRPRARRRALCQGHSRPRRRRRHLRRSGRALTPSRVCARHTLCLTRSLVSPSRCTARSPSSTHSTGSSTTTTTAPPTARTPPASIPYQVACSVVDWSTPAILSRNAWKVFDEMSTQQEASWGGVLPVTNMLRLPTISSTVMTNKNTSTPFFALEPVQLSTSLFNVIKFAMPLCTWVFSGTYGMQMLVSFGDHVVFDRGKHIESLLRPFHPTNSTLSAAVPVKLLWSSTQTRMVFLQDAYVTVQLPEVCAVQEQFCWYSHIPSMSVHGAVGCFLVIASRHFVSLSPSVTSSFTSAEDDHTVVGLFVYTDVLFPWVSGNCPVTGFALWDPGGVVLQLVWSHMLEISCHFILVLLVEFWNPMWLPIFTFKMQWLLLNQSFVFFKLPHMLNLQTGLEIMQWKHPQILLQEVSVATSLRTQPYHIVGAGDVSAAMKVKLLWSSPHLRMMLLHDFCWLFNCPRSLCISCNIILMGGSGSISYQFVTGWSYKRERIMLLWSQQQKTDKTASVMLQVVGLSPLAGSKLCKSIVSVQTVLMLHDVDTFRQDKLLATSDRVLDKYRRWVNDLHLLGSECCSTSLEHPIFIFLDMMENSSVILPIQKSENDLEALIFGQMFITGEHCTDLMTEMKEMQWKPPWLSMQLLLRLMVPLQLCSHPVRYQLHQSKWIPVQFSSAEMSQAAWDPGGFKSGLRASRILSGGECQVPGSVGRDTWAWVQTSAQLPGRARLYIWA